MYELKSQRNDEEITTIYAVEVLVEDLINSFTNWVTNKKIQHKIVPSSFFH